jgi:hypothetical protein
LGASLSPGHCKASPSLPDTPTSRHWQPLRLRVIARPCPPFRHCETPRSRVLQAPPFPLL